MSVLARLKKSLGINEIAFTYSQNRVQNELAPTLRQKAIQHLATADGVVAKGFRGEYLASGMGHYQDFLRVQSQTGTWGTYIEASALGEAMGCHVVVTPVKSGVQQNPICLYRASDDKAPTVHLYNADNAHWYVNTNTKGDGNCLFNAFAQALQTIVKPELPSVSSTIVSPQFTSYKFRAVTNEAQVINHQHAIAASIRQHPTPSEVEATLQNEKVRIGKLSVAEQQQISDDHKFALAIACEEMKVASKRMGV